MLAVPNLTSTVLIEKNDENPSELEGAWYNPDSESHLYSKIVDGVLYTPYCFRGDNELTAAYFNWQRIGEYWFAMFEWIDADVSGFALYKLTSQNEIQGARWPNDGSIEIEEITQKDFDPNTGGGTPAIWRKMHDDKEYPDWAESFFAALKTDCFENVWKNIKKM